VYGIVEKAGVCTVLEVDHAHINHVCSV
jgi:hypothetical protein